MLNQHITHFYFVQIILTIQIDSKRGIMKED